MGFNQPPEKTFFTDWHNAANWSCGVLPDTGATVVIPATANHPSLSSATIIGNLSLQGILHINGQNCTINGAVTGSGSFSGSATSKLTITGNAGLLRFATGAATLQKLQINTGGNATVGANLIITGQ